jgi:hypothetical protein
MLIPGLFMIVDEGPAARSASVPIAAKQDLNTSRPPMRSRSSDTIAIVRIPSENSIRANDFRHKIHCSLTSASELCDKYWAAGSSNLGFTAREQ